MLLDAAQFLLKVACELAASAFWLRFYMQLCRVPFANPFAQFIVRVTDFAVRPLRRIIPGMFGLDWASLVLFFLCEFLWAIGSHMLAGYPFLVAGGWVWPGFALLTFAACLNLIAYIAMALVLVQALISWINPYSPVAPMLYALSQPLLKPFQRFIPPIAGIDITPVIVLIVLQLLVLAPIAGLERYALSLIW